MRELCVILCFLSAIGCFAATTIMRGPIGNAGVTPTVTPTPTPTATPSGAVSTSGNWTGFATTSTVASSVRTLTGSGTIRFAISKAGCTAKYFYNGVGPTTFVNGDTKVVTDGGSGNTLQLEITGSGSGSSMAGNVLNDGDSTLIGTIDLENTTP